MTERKRAKKEKKAEKQAKFQEWEQEWKDKQREADQKKARKVQKQREKEEAAKSSFERNVGKYEIWGSKDAKGKMMIDRYQLYKTPEEKAKARANEQANQNPHVSSPSPNRASTAIRSKMPPKREPTTQVYTPKVSSAIHDSPKTDVRMHPGTSQPRPSSFSNNTVELRHKNNVCYWPKELVTLENLQERFGIKKPAMRLASVPKGPLAIKFKVQPDGTYQVQGGQAYVVFNLKDKTAGRETLGAQDEALTYEQKVMRFLTMAKFTRGEVLTNSGMGTQKMVREEAFEFTPEGRFALRIFKGYKDVEGSLKEEAILVGKYKMKNKHKTVLLVWDKPKKGSGDGRAQDKLAEKKETYKKWFIPGDGTLQCYADQSIRFK